MCFIHILYNINEDYAVIFKNAHGNLENRIKTEAALGVSFAGRSLWPCDRGLAPRKFMFFVNFIKCVVLYAPYTQCFAKFTLPGSNLGPEPHGPYLHYIVVYICITSTTPAIFHATIYLRIKALRHCTELDPTLLIIRLKST